MLRCDFVTNYMLISVRFIIIIIKTLRHFFVQKTNKTSSDAQWNVFILIEEQRSNLLQSVGFSCE